MRVLCAHRPEFASASIDYHIHCFITEACARPPDKIGPVIHVLLDYGADLNNGMLGGAGALYAAILGSQSMEIIDRILESKPPYAASVGSFAISEAIKKERVDILQRLLRDSRVREKEGKVEADIEKAKKTENPEMIAEVQRYALELIAKREKEERRARKRWWQVCRS